MKILTRLANAQAGDHRAVIGLLKERMNWHVDDIARYGRGDPVTRERGRIAIVELQGIVEREIEEAVANRILPIGEVPRRGAPLTPTVVGIHEAKTVSQLQRCLDHDDAVAGALCADGHYGYSQPVGGAVAYREHVSISGVGYDIGCGNMAVRTDLCFRDIRNRLPTILDGVWNRVSFGMGRNNPTPVRHAMFDDRDAWLAADALDLRDRSRHQLGTVGGGNHYVDIFREVADGVDDDQSRVWIGVHFGSRGLGHTLATRYLKLAGGRDGLDNRPTLVHQDSDLGRGYIAAMELAGRFAYAGREWVVDQVLQELGAEADYGVHNHHNFAWREQVAGAPAWVVRKGCTPAYPGQQGFVGGSMGDDAVILEGVQASLSEGLIHSTVHGAGRTFGRDEAKRRYTREEMDAWLARRGVLLRGGEVDESPMAYRRLDDVLAMQGDTINVLHRLRPVVVAMAEAGVIDPYKD